MDYSRHVEVLGVNRMGKNIKKSPVHQPSFANNSGFAARPQPPSQVYNINKSDFRNIVQQLTGSPSQNTSLPRPLQNPSKNHPGTRLQRIRPAPLMPMNQPQFRVAHSNNYVTPAATAVCSRPLSPAHNPFNPIDVWENSGNSPVSAYMQCLQGSIIDSAGPKQAQPHDFLANPPLPSPWMNGDAPILSPLIMNDVPPPPPPPLLPSPNGFVNLFSPCTPYPLFSPGVQHPPPLSPKFSFSPMGQPGILSPLSPSYGFPLSPSGFFAVCSPRWRDQ
ncbi:PREDICTED: protein HAIKU1-like isoform X2 [Ipomoea nil]|uniref:protein HAIKU1-like isoform X2 n=1 Tax=Ipomoea nil TaxID=35883 RepID=UPI0009018351|nr:PREDICTED: protein HAIKU1-like isoform X2 [Ipomoea nil]